MIIAMAHQAIKTMVQIMVPAMAQIMVPTMALAMDQGTAQTIVQITVRINSSFRFVFRFF